LNQVRVLADPPEADMNDLIYVLIALGMFVACIAAIYAFERVE
jgi:hypothetical protein